MIKLYESVKRRWLEALRSGEYSQGIGNLGCNVISPDSKEGEFCCLGVAVMEFVPANLKYVARDGRLTSGNKKVLSKKIPVDACMTFFGVGVRDWEIKLDYQDIQMLLNYPEIRLDLLASLNKAKIYGERGYLFCDLTVLNDSGVPFTVIADLIEKHAETIPDPEKNHDQAV